MNTFTNTLTRNQQLIIGALLLLMLVITRSHLINHIYDASWAIFFMVGFYFRGSLTASGTSLTRYSFPLFWLVAFATDLLVIESKGGESYCFTASYPFLIPAYASLWMAGRWFANHYSENLRGLLYFVGAAVVGITVCDIISSGGFYWFSGRFTDENMTEFVSRIATYLPLFMKTTMMYLGFATVLHLVIKHSGKITGSEQHS